MTNKRLTQSIYENDQTSPGLLFWRSFYNWQRFIREALDPLNVTQVQFSIMAALYYLSSDKSAVTQQDIANTLSMDKMMVSDVVKTLLKKKYFERQPHPHDARAHSLFLTPAGRERLRKCVPLVEAIDEKFFRSTGSNYESFFEALRMLARFES